MSTRAPLTSGKYADESHEPEEAAEAAEETIFVSYEGPFVRYFSGTQEITLQRDENPRIVVREGTKLPWYSLLGDTSGLDRVNMSHEGPLSPLSDFESLWDAFNWLMDRRVKDLAKAPRPKRKVSK